MSKNKPKISIIFAMLNGENFLKRNLDSIKILSSLKEIELIIIDNNSNDNSLEIIDSYADQINIKILKQKKNLGYAKASNIGVQNASGEFIFITNVDVIYPIPTFFEKLLKIYSEYKRKNEIAISPALVFEGDGIHYFGAKIHLLGFTYTKRMYEKLPENPIVKRTQRFSGGTLFMKKKLFLELGGYDNNFFIYNEDTDLSLKMLRKKLEMYTTNDPYLIHQHHQMVFSDLKYYLYERNKYLAFFKNVDNFKKLIPFFILTEFLLIFHAIAIKKFKYRVVLYYELLKNRNNIKELRKKIRKESPLLPYQRLSKKLDPVIIVKLKRVKILFHILKLFNFLYKKI